MSIPAHNSTYLNRSKVTIVPSFGRQQFFAAITLAVLQGSKGFTVMLFRNSKTAFRRSKGFTLVELLVVIAIIAVLIGLLLPAVQSARESARRSQCTNKLKQIGLAVHNYENTYKALPASYGVGPAPQEWGGLTFIMPFMELQNLFDQLGFDRRPPDGRGRPTIAQQPLLAQAIPAYICPSCAGPSTNPNAENLGKSNYVMSESVFPHPGNQAAGQPFHPWGTPITMNQITDGLSNTIMLSERALGGTPFRSFGAIWSGRAGTNSSGTARGSWPPNTPWRTGSDPCTRHAWTSYHPGGINLTLCDASVRFVSEAIDSQTDYASCNETEYQRLLQRARQGEQLRVYQNLFLRNSGSVIGSY
jgi:prepilin-type N-terminal cleavage/methylation domain-containing protein